MQGGSKEIKDLEKLWEVNTVFQRITITSELSEPERRNQVIVPRQRVRQEHGRQTLSRPCAWVGPTLLGEAFSDNVSKWLRVWGGERWGAGRWWGVDAHEHPIDFPRARVGHWRHFVGPSRGVHCGSGMHPGSHIP